MVDVDNVYIGGSGRMQRPVDFNRDWSLEPYWLAVEEIQKQIIATSNLYKYRIFFDFHSTYPGTLRPTFGLFNEYTQFDKGFKRLRNYFQIFKTNSGYELVELSGDLKNYYADAYNSGQLYPFIKTKDFSTTVECDWNINNNYKDLTINELKNVGRLMAESLCDYLNK
jgi:hypothetical protein